MSSYEFLFDETAIDATVQKTGDGWRVIAGGKQIEIAPLSEGLFTVTVEGRSYRAAAVKGKDSWYLDIDSVLVELIDSSELGFASGTDHHHGHTKDKVFAPMPGKIVKLLVNVGDHVSLKQPLVIVEAMKMENSVLSPANGTIKAVHHAPGDQVNTDQPIIELELE